MKVNFGPLTLVLMVVLAITAAFGFMLNSTEMANPSLQRAQATAVIWQAEMNRALTATPYDQQNQLIEATLAPMRATATAIALSTELQVRSTTATASALENRKRTDEIVIEERQAALTWQRDTDQIIFVAALVLIGLLAACLMALIVSALIDHIVKMRARSAYVQSAVINIPPMTRVPACPDIRAKPAINSIARGTSTLNPINTNRRNGNNH